MTETQRPVLLISRSAYEERRRCARAFYYRYLYARTGYTEKRTPFHLAFGIALHVGMEMLLRSALVDAALGAELDPGAAIEAAKTAWVVERPGGSYPPAEPPEAEVFALLTAMILGWCRVEAPRFFEEYEVVKVEEEGTPQMLSPSAALQFRADVVVRSRYTGLLRVINWKCEHPDQRVDMADGTKKAAKDVQVGDELLTGRVSEVGPGGLQDRWTIKTKKGRLIRVSGNHPFKVHSNWIEARHLHQGDALEVVVAPPNDREYATTFEARLLGYLVGDGGLSGGSVTFATGCEETVQTVRRLSDLLGFEMVPASSKKRSVNWRIVGAVPWVRRFGLSGLKSAEKFIPDAVLKSSDEVKLAFLGALFDADGSINDKRTQVKVNWHTTSRRLADDVQLLLTQLGVPASVWRQKNKKYNGEPYENYSVYVQSQAGTGRLCFLLKDHVAKPHKRVLMERHARLCYPHISDEVDYVVMDDIGETVAIGVEESHTVALSSILTHNTSSAWGDWTDSWSSEVQSFTEAWALEKESGEAVEGTVMAGFHKGSMRQTGGEAHFSSPLVWGYKKTTDDGRALYWSDTKAPPKDAKYVKFRVWEEEFPLYDEEGRPAPKARGVAAWVAWLPLHAVASQFMTSEVLTGHPKTVADFIAAAGREALTDHHVLTEGSEQDRLAHFTPKFGKYSCGTREKPLCPFWKVCFTDAEITDLIAEGTLVPRVDHHAVKEEV